MTHPGSATGDRHGFGIPVEDQRNLYAPDNPPGRLGIGRHRHATHSQVIEVIEVTSEKSNRSKLEAGLNPLAKQIVTFST